jgi:glycosyltransferase involved in cell wall biosynthesis
VAGRRGRSGIRTYTDALVDGLAALSHEVVVLDETGVAPSQDARTGRVRSLPLAPPPGRPAALGPVAGWVRRPEVLRAARELEVDVVHVTHLDLAPRFDRVVVTAWDPVPGPLARYRAARSRGERPLEEAQYALVDAWACRRAAAVVAVTQDVARAVGRSRRPVHWIPPFLPDDAIRAPLRRSSDVVMVANGLDAPRKGLELALDAVALVRRVRPEVRLTLVGSWVDPRRPDQLPDYCDVTGPLPRQQVLELLPGFGCCVLPSLWEEFGYGALEALGAGVPLACAPGLGFTGLSGGGIFAAGRRQPQALADQVLLALDVRDFEFPSECRAAHALGRLVDLYEVVAGRSR